MPDLSVCMQLRILHVVWLESYHEERQGTGLGPMLESLGSRALENFVLVLSPGEEREWRYDKLDWRRWERALSRERQPLLRSLDVSWRASLDPDIVEWWLPSVRRMLPELDARGLLQPIKGVRQQLF